jgi:hypothetical protein
MCDKELECREFDCREGECPIEVMRNNGSYSIDFDDGALVVHLTRKQVAQLRDDLAWVRGETN